MLSIPRVSRKSRFLLTYVRKDPGNTYACVFYSYYGVLNSYEGEVDSHGYLSVIGLYSSFAI